MNRLALGTAQFGLDYGVANRTGRVSANAIRTILSRAALAGVDTLDTAVAYGSSEASLGEAGVASWRVVTKLPPLADGVGDVRTWVQRHVSGSMQRLGVDRLEAVLLHRPADLLGAHGRDYRRALDELQAEGHVDALGVSVYDPAELDALWPVWRPRLVQAPCNVFDRRLIDSGWLPRLNDAAVRVHVRSVLLQGLLAMPATQRPRWFDHWNELLNRWSQWCLWAGVEPIAAAIAFVGSYAGIERYVMGVDALRQLDELLAAQAIDVPRVPEDLRSDDVNLLEPSRWMLA
jgi:aryl-alcohol dehydrogenase-like predicted oxidoreductase